MNHLTRVSGGLNVLSGGLLLSYWFAYVAFMPYMELTTTLSILVLHPAWTAINLVGVLGATTGLLALPGLYAVQAERIGWSGLASFLISLLGAALLLGPMLWDTILWLPLAKHDPAILSFTGPIYGSAAFIPFFVTSGLLWGLGMAVLGFRTAKAGVLPRLPAGLVAVGAPLFGLGALFGKAQAVPRTLGISAFAIGLILLGVAMLKLTAAEE